MAVILYDKMNVEAREGLTCKLHGSGNSGFFANEVNVALQQPLLF